MISYVAVGFVQTVTQFFTEIQRQLEKETLEIIQIPAGSSSKDHISDAPSNSERDDTSHLRY